MKFPVFSLLTGNLALPETSSLLTASSTGESDQAECPANVIGNRKQSDARLRVAEKPPILILDRPSRARPQPADPAAAICKGGIEAALAAASSRFETSAIVGVAPGRGIH